MARLGTYYRLLFPKFMFLAGRIEFLTSVGDLVPTVKRNTFIFISEH